MLTYDVRGKAINAYIENILLLLPIHGENTFDNLKASLFCKADYDKLNKYLGILAPTPCQVCQEKVEFSTIEEVISSRFLVKLMFHQLRMSESSW